MPSATSRDAILHLRSSTQPRCSATAPIVVTKTTKHSSTLIGITSASTDPPGCAKHFWAHALTRVSDSAKPLIPPCGSDRNRQVAASVRIRSLAASAHPTSSGAAACVRIRALVWPPPPPIRLQPSSPTSSSDPVARFADRFAPRLHTAQEKSRQQRQGSADGNQHSGTEGRDWRGGRGRGGCSRIGQREGRRPQPRGRRQSPGA